MKLLCVIIFIVIAIVAYRVNRRGRNDDDQPEQKQEARFDSGRHYGAYDECAS